MAPGRRRIGLNLLWLVPGEVGGSEEYTIGLITAVAAMAPADVELIVYANRRLVEVYPEVLASFSTVIAPISGSSRPLRILTESTWLAVRSRSDRVEVVHHAGGTMPPIRLRPGLVTLHDLQPITHPERFGFVKRTYIRLLAPRSLRRAVRVVCLSRFTADDAIRIAGVEPSRIAIVPSGVELDPVGPAVAEPDVLERLGLHERRYLLYPAITYEHKNHRTLVEAFARLLPTHPDLRLVLTGGTGGAEEALLERIDELGLADRVVRTGRVPASDLDSLYRGAMLTAFPSSYEGFGLPVLEAMSRRCPVVASDVGGLPEVGGAAVDLVDPFDVDGWAAALALVIDEPVHRSAMITRGLEQCGRHRWSESAASLLELYRGLPRTSVSPS